VTIPGTTMGTTYQIKFLGRVERDLKPEIDSLLESFNQSLSTYIPESEISRFNADTVFYFDLPFFLPVLKESKRIFNATGGAFDPTVMPLVRAWGFGPDKPELPDSSKIDSLLEFIGFEKISFDENKVVKSFQGVELDLSAVAKGYAVDVVAELLTDKGIENYFIEIGGEVICKGVNDRGGPWKVGIEDPTIEIVERSAKAIIELKDRAMATSGNYRNYYIIDGVKYSHTIDPESGFPVQHQLLSATVFASRCITADAFATAFMVVGIEKSKKILEKNSEIDGFLIYIDRQGKLMTYASPGVGKIEILQ